MGFKILVAAVFFMALNVSEALAAGALNSGDTAWMIVSTALVWMAAEWVTSGTCVVVSITRLVTGGIPVGPESEVLGPDGVLYSECAFDIE